MAKHQAKADAATVAEEQREVPDAVAEFFKDEPEPRLIVPTPEGWRHSLPDVDVDERQIRSRSVRIGNESLERVSEEKLSEGEKAFLKQTEDEFA